LSFGIQYKYALKNYRGDLSEENSFGAHLVKARYLRWQHLNGKISEMDSQGRSLEIHKLGGRLCTSTLQNI